MASAVGGAVGSVVATVGSGVGVAGTVVGPAVVSRGTGTVVGEGTAGMAETVGWAVAAVVGRDVGVVVLVVAGLVVGAAVVAWLAGASVVVGVFSVGVRAAVRFAVGVDVGVDRAATVSAGEGTPGRLRDGTAAGSVVAFAGAVPKADGAAVDAGDTVVVTAVVDTSSKYTVGVMVGVTVASVVPAVGPGVGDAGTAVSAGDAGTAAVPYGTAGIHAGVAAGVALPEGDTAPDPPCMNAAISGGITGEANPTAKSTMQATTPAPIRCLRIFSPSIGSCDGRSRG